MSMLATDTPNVYTRGKSFTVRWSEAGRRRCRAFPTYEAACAFQRDAVDPYTRGQTHIPPSVRLAGKGQGWVYLLQSQGAQGVVKVGWTQDLHKRVRDLRAHHPHDLHLVAALPGSRGLERTLHQRLAARRLRGEWYVREVIADVSALLLGVVER
jgi:hypothetical protein